MNRHVDTLEILITARHLEAQGLRPNPKLVRRALGGGSPAAISAALSTAHLTSLEDLIARRRRELEVNLLDARRQVAEIEAEMARLEELELTLPSAPAER